MKRLAAVLILILLALALVLRARQQRRVPAEAQGQWPVMGTFLTVRALAPAQPAADGAQEAARATVFRIDSLMSTWKPASDISRLNRAAGTSAWTALAPETVVVLRAALALSAASGGAFDVTVGPLMHAWGFRDEHPGRPDAAELAAARVRVGYRHLELDTMAGRARLLRAGVAVDLGAIAKGYALDEAARAMRARGATAGLVDLGGNVLVFGPPPEGREAWTVGIRDPRDPERLIGTIALRAGSVATSGDYEQFFEAGGVRYSHIMDPLSAEPARGVLQTTVLAPTGLQADGLSTALFVLGPARGRALLPPGAAAAWVLDSLPLDPGDVIVAGSAANRIRLELSGRR